MKKDPDLCPICGQDPGAITKCFAAEPFIDGRTYDFICYTCASVQKNWEIIDGEIVTYTYSSPDRIRTTQEMVEDGWTADRANRSIKAIQKLLRRPKINVESVGKHVFVQLFLDLTEIPAKQFVPC